MLYGETQGQAVRQERRLRLLNRTSSVAEILQERRASGKAALTVGPVFRSWIPGLTLLVRNVHGSEMHP